MNEVNDESSSWLKKEEDQSKNGLKTIRKRVPVRLLRNHASHVPDGWIPSCEPDSKTILEPVSTWATKDRVSNDAPGRIGTRSRFLFCVPKYFVIMKTKRRAIFVRLPESLVDRLDSVTYDLRMRSRSDYIRRSIERALEFSEAHEVPCSMIPTCRRALAR